MSPDHNRSSSLHQRVKRTIWVNQCSEPQRDLLMQDSMVYMYELIWREWVTSSNRGTSCVRQTPPTFLRAVDQHGAVKVATQGDGNNLPCSRVIIVATQPQPTFGRLSHTTDKLVCGMSTYPNVGEERRTMQADSVSQCPRKPPWSPHIIMARALHWLGFNLAQIDIASLKFQTKLATLPCILKASHLIWYSKRCYRYLTVSDPNKALLYLLCLLLRHETIISFSKL